MDRIYVFIIRNDVWIYILAALGLFWYSTELMRAQHLLRRAMFGLERERGARMRSNALLSIALLLVVVGLVYYVNSRVAPQLPPELLRPPTPTPDIFATPLLPPTPLSGGVVEDLPATLPALAPTVTLPGQAPPVGIPTSTPETPPTPFIGCRINLNFSQPRDGTAVSRTVGFFGTVATPNFQYYLLEINGPQTNGLWASLLGRTVNQPVEDSFLGEANLSQWEAGPYLVRLTAVDTNDNVTGQCAIQITLTGG